MADDTRKHVDDLRGATRLAIDATLGVSELVEELHRTVASGPDILGRPLEWPARLLTGLVHGQVRRVTRIVGSSVDFALAQLAPLLGGSMPGAEREALQALLNGVLGDYLEETRNPLAIELGLRADGQRLTLDEAALRLALPMARRRVLVMIHGLCMGPRTWRWQGHDHGDELARELGYTVLYAHYNSGRHISTNGRELAALLEQLVAAWPAPLDELALVGYSMGGLVARSACHAGEVAAQRWRRKLSSLVCIGTPHHGAALERGGNWIGLLLGVSPYSAPFARLARVRSAGVTDLRFGNVLDEHWAGRDRFAPGGDERHPLPLPEGVRCYAIAGSASEAGSERPAGDGLVSIDSALGHHEREALRLAFPPDHQHLCFGVHHLDLLNSVEVYTLLQRWLA